MISLCDMIKFVKYIFCRAVSYWIDMLSSGTSPGAINWYFRRRQNIIFYQQWLQSSLHSHSVSEASALKSVLDLFANWSSITNWTVPSFTLLTALQDVGMKKYFRFKILHFRQLLLMKLHHLKILTWGKKDPGAHHSSWTWAPFMQTWKCCKGKRDWEGWNFLWWKTNRAISDVDIWFLPMFETSGRRRPTWQLYGSSRT